MLETFVDLCSSWGVPTYLLLDRGSEFAALDLAHDLFQLKAACRLAPHVEGVKVEEVRFGEPGVHRARAYNPQSKVIETIFSILNTRLLPMLPAYIGGNRMTKKTQNQGRAPTPYPGTLEQFEADLAKLFSFYHNKPQAKRSHLRGQSPNQRYSEQFAAGWQPARLKDTDRIGHVFCKTHTRAVYAGGNFNIDGILWRSDRLLTRARGRVTVRVPLIGDRGRIFVYDEQNREFLGEATPAPVFGWGDPAGAHEQTRQSHEVRKQVRKLKAQGDPIDPVMAVAATNAEFGAPPALEPAGRVIDAVPEKPRRKKDPSSLELWAEEARKNTA